MKRWVLVLLGLGLLLLALCRGEGLCLPEGVKRVESEAFLNAAVDWVYIPEGCNEIADDSFSDDVAIIYGWAGSAAENFAKSTGREFADVGAYDVKISCTDLCLPEAKIRVSTYWTCNFPLKASYALYESGELISASDSGSLTAAKSGSMDVYVTLSGKFFTKTFVFPKAISVMSPPKAVSDEFFVPLGESVKLFYEDEGREYTIFCSSKTGITIEGDCVTGNKLGRYSLSVSVSQQGLKLTRTYPLTVYTKAEQISADVPEFGYVGEHFYLNAQVLPSDATFKQISYSSSNPEIIGVDENGVLSFNSVGWAVIALEAKDVSESVSVYCANAPTNVTLSCTQKYIAQGASVQSHAFVEPAGAMARLKYESSDESVAVVDKNGLVTGVSAGSAYISCTNGEVSSGFYIEVKSAPQSVKLSADFTYMFPAEARALEIEVYPTDTELNEIKFASSDVNVATVDANGIVSAVSGGECVISATAASGAYAEFNVHVWDYPDNMGVSLAGDRVYINVGDSLTLSPVVYPAGANYALEWTSSDESVISVDQDGAIFAHAVGTAEISCRIKDSDICASAIIVAIDDSDSYAPCLVMPLRRTTLSGIQANLQRIENVKACAIRELKALYDSGAMGDTEYAMRGKIISGAFESYAFAWTPDDYLPYWSEENDDGGVKNFESGVIYYGLPYISGTYDKNRQYNFAKALSEGRYYPSEDGTYYFLDTHNLPNDNYAGCDCSSLVCIAYYGVNKTALRTGALYYSAEFKTLTYDDELFPGDIIVANNRHVVMFLYYANAEHTQIVTIEQGGIEPTVNTVSASVYPISYYEQRGFVPRRNKYWRE